MSEHEIDAVLVVSFGGPEGPGDVIPFLRNVTRGRNVPDERLEEVAGHYHHFGGRSPINDEVRRFIEALEVELRDNGPDLPIYWGNRNWYPFLPEAIDKMAADGRRHAVAFVTSAYSSYSSCRQYKDDIATALDAVGATTLRVDKIRPFYNHPDFIGPMAAHTLTALMRLPDESRSGAHIVFTAHSIPLAMAEACRYESQIQEAARLVIEEIARDHTQAWSVAYQSRSGPTEVPWLESDIGEHLRSLHASGTSSVVMVPIGFMADHMEVLYDLDTEVARVAESLNMATTRAKTVGADPRFVSGVRKLIVEHLDPTAEREALGPHGPVDCLPVDCCPTPNRRATSR